MCWSAASRVIVVAIERIRPVEELADVSADHIVDGEGSTRMSEGIAAQIKDQVIQNAELLSLLYSRFKFLFRNNFFQVRRDKRVFLLSLPSKSCLKTNRYEQHREQIQGSKHRPL